MTDTELIDFLEMENAKARYTGRCMLRLSTTGRGWRLHETSDINSRFSVREAIEAYINEQKLTNITVGE